MIVHRGVIKAYLLLALIFSLAVYRFASISAASNSVVELSPGSYSHALGASEDAVKLDYPKGAIMLSTIGDFVFNLTTSVEHRMIQIYIPPEFGFVTPDTRSVWTSITNDYRYISLGKAGEWDRIAPGWWLVAIKGLEIPSGTYIIRLFEVTAPEIQGRYFFKVFLDGRSIGADKFPTVVVEGGSEPAYISGKVLCGEPGDDYGKPVNGPGMVTAVGTTLDGRTVKAQAYFNSSSGGAYTLYGLAAGTYELTASAAGFAPTTHPRIVTVMPGQSLVGVDIYLKPGAKINGVVWSKCKGGLVQWGRSIPIRVELLDSEGKLLGLIKGNVSSEAYNYEFTVDKVMLDGHVPQDCADYVSGIDNGYYFLEAYAAGYVQKEIAAVNIFGQKEVDGVGIDLLKGGRIEVTVHFTDPAAKKDAPLPSSRRLTLSVYSMDGSLKGKNSTTVPGGSSSWTMEVLGISNSTRDCGLPEGAYLVEAALAGYVQQTFPLVTISGCGAVGKVSVIMAKGGSANITIRSVDQEKPLREVEWAYPGAPIRVELRSPSGELIVVNATQPAPPSTSVTINVTGLSTGLYLINVYTFGYVQTRAHSFSASIGCATAFSIYLVKGVKISADVEFLSGGVFSRANTYPFGERIPIRVEVYDRYWSLVGANVTYISKSVSFKVEVAGFKQYAGDAAHRWVNYYDTTNGTMQLDYGLAPGTYTIRVLAPGYLQEGEATVTPPPLGLASITIRLHRLSRISGLVYGLDMFGNPLPLSWARVTAFNGVEFTTYTMDGHYDLWLPHGDYTLSISLTGYETRVITVRLAPGSETKMDITMLEWGTQLQPRP